MKLLDYAKQYVGDPNSFDERGKCTFDMLLREGMGRNSRVLEIGSGALCSAQYLLPFLGEHGYVGIEPNGWLTQVGLWELNLRVLADTKRARFLECTDFDASKYGPFDFAISHSVLSHCAHWQMEQLLQNVRKAMTSRGVFLCSLRLSDRNSYAQQWQYPGISTFRLDTLRVIGYHVGWRVEHDPLLRQQMIEVAPNDIHDWIRFRACESAATQNLVRLADEAQRELEQRVVARSQRHYERLQKAREDAIKP